MGFVAPVEFHDAVGRKWVGQHRPEFIDLGQVFQRVITSIDEVATSEILADTWRTHLPEGVSLVQVLGARTAHVHVAKAPLTKNIVIKIATPSRKGTLRALTARVEHSRSHRAHLWGHRLRALGIDTPRPLGYCESADRPALHPSCCVTEYIYAPTLVEIRDTKLQTMRLQEQGLIEKRDLIDRVAGVVRQLHMNGLFHGDLHAGNVLITDGGVMVIDLESMRRSNLLSGRNSVRNLVRINRDFLDRRLVSRTDRLRFLRSYLRHHPGQPSAWRALWSSVHERTTQKLEERGERFQ